MNDPSKLWREVTLSLEEAGNLMASAHEVDELQHAEEVFRQAEGLATERLEQHPALFVGRQPYEGHYRSATAGRLLCGILRRIQQLRKGEIDKQSARGEIEKMAIELLNLRADHGRFFDTLLNDRINQVERLYQKLLSRQ